MTARLDALCVERSRGRLLAAAPALIVPGHGEPFAPGELGAGAS